MQENTFDIGWQECAKRVFGIGRHISATGLNNTHFAPASLKQALTSNNPDRDIWDKSYNEEYDGLDNLNVFTEIMTEKYREYVVKYGEKARFIPTIRMCQARLRNRSTRISNRSPQHPFRTREFETRIS